MTPLDNQISSLKKKISEFDKLLKDDSSYLNSVLNLGDEFRALVEHKNKLVQEIERFLNIISGNLSETDEKHLKRLLEFFTGQINFFIRLNKNKIINENTFNSRVKVYSQELNLLSLELRNLDANLSRVNFKNFFDRIKNFGFRSQSKGINLKIIDEVFKGLNERGLNLEEEQKKGIQDRLIRFLSKNELDVSSFCDGVVEYEQDSRNERNELKKSFLNDLSVPVNVILSYHTQKTREKIYALKRKVMESKGGELTIILKDEKYVLYRLESKEHLETESTLSGHCVGTNEHYIRGVVNGQIEIFSFRDIKGNFLLTLEYDISKKSIEQIKGKNNELLSGEEEYFLDFLKFLKDLKRTKNEFDNQREIEVIKDLNEMIKEREILTTKGVISQDEIFSQSREDIISGNLVLDDTNFKKFEKILTFNLIFDLTEVSEKFTREIKEVGGDLADSKKNCNYNKLQIVGGNFYADSAESLNLQALQIVGKHFSANRAKTLSLQALQTVGGGFYTSRAKTLSLQVLQKVGGGFYTKSAESLDLQALQTVGKHFSASRAKTLSLQALQTVGGNFYADSTKTLSLQALQTVGGGFYADSTKTLSLQVLQKVGGDFYAESAETLNLQTLQSVGVNFSAESAETLNLQTLQSVGGDFHAKSAENLNLLMIKEIKGQIYLNVKLKEEVLKRMEENNR